jgi:hypothetical protein
MQESFLDPDADVGASISDAKDRLRNGAVTNLCLLHPARRHRFCHAGALEYLLNNKKD